MRCLCCERDALLGFVQLPFLLQNVTHIDAPADVTNKFSLRIVARHTLIIDVTISTFTMTQTVLHGEWCPRIKCAGVGRQTAIEIVRMHTFAPAVAELFFYWSSPKFEPRP